MATLLYLIFQRILLTRKKQISYNIYNYQSQFWQSLWKHHITLHHNLLLSIGLSLNPLWLWRVYLYTHTNTWKKRYTFATATKISYVIKHTTNLKVKQKIWQWQCFVLMTFESACHREDAGVSIWKWVCDCTDAVTSYCVVR